MINKALPTRWPFEKIVHFALQCRLSRFPLSQTSEPIVKHLKQNKSILIKISYFSSLRREFGLTRRFKDSNLKRLNLKLPPD